MKPLTFSIDLKSVALGAILTGGLLTLANFKPSEKPAQDPGDAKRRYQVIMDERGTLILDTQTGNFLIDPSASLRQPRWQKVDFNAIQATEK